MNVAICVILVFAVFASCARSRGGSEEARKFPDRSTPRTHPPGNSSPKMEPSPPVDAAKKDRFGRKARFESPYCLFGCPESAGASNNRLLVREGFVLSNNPHTKFADFAAYHVTPATIGRSKREPWQEDPDLRESETLEPDDFVDVHRSLGMDRGHQVPLASFSGTAGWRALGYTSNLTPQRSELNQGLWNRLEQAERDLALEVGASGVYVVTGPLFEREMAKLPRADEAHRVPSGYFKVVALAGEPEVAAFIVEQETPGDDSHCLYQTPVDTVELRSGLDLFVSLEDRAEIALESALGSLGRRLGCGG